MDSDFLRSTNLFVYILRQQKPIYQVIICGHDFLLYQFSEIECYKSQYMLKEHLGGAR